ncbi:hypothetical protein AAG570_013437, partial [Ranatra chinensis]
RAGSRYESAENFGASHVIRSSAGLTTSKATQFGIMRNLQQIGAYLSATSDRETITYTLETSCNNVQDGMKYLKYVVTNQAFKPWELGDNATRIRYELETVPLKAKLLNYLHMAAYRKGLGNNMFVRDYNIKKLGTETLQHYVHNTFLTHRAAVTGVGVDHGVLVEFADNLQMQSGSGRQCMLLNIHSVRICSLTPFLLDFIVYFSLHRLTKKEVFAYSVLSYALGGRPCVKWGIGVDPLTKSLANVQSPTAAQAINIAHSDSGLFAVLVSSTPDTAGYAMEAVMKVLKGGVSEEDVKRGKAQLKSEVLMSGESCQGLLADLSTQSVLMGAARSPSQLATGVDAVTTAQVKEVRLEPPSLEEVFMR